MLNQVILVGRLAGDPEIKDTPIGKPVCEITIATDRPFKNATTHTVDSDFVKVTMWDILAINTNEYCKKGATVAIKGRIQMKSTKIGTTLISIPEIIGEHIVFIAKPISSYRETTDELFDEENQI